MAVIDMHCHLGDILYPGGGAVIRRTGLRMPGLEAVRCARSRARSGRCPDDIRRSRLRLADARSPMPADWDMKGERARNAKGTLENLRQALDFFGTRLAVCMPVAPHVTYDDLLWAVARESRLAAFTSIDFALGPHAVDRVVADLRGGASGLKLHPILQRRLLTDPVVADAVCAAGAEGKPVLVHTGAARYYLAGELHLQAPEFGRAERVCELVLAFPATNFVVGHAGLREVAVVLATLRNAPNAWVDTSFQAPEMISRLVNALGSDRVLYASDWPWGYPGTEMRSVRLACGGDRALEAKVFCRNAEVLLGRTVG